MALSRVRSPQDVKVINYTKYKCFKQPLQLLTFTSRKNEELRTDKSCCTQRAALQNLFVETPVMQEDVFMENDDEDDLVAAVDDLDEQHIAEVLNNMGLVQCVPELPYQCDLPALLDAITPSVETDTETTKNMKGLIRVLDVSKLTTFCVFTWNTLAQCFDRACPSWKEKPVETKEMTAYSKDFRSFLVSPTYKAARNTLYCKVATSVPENLLAFKIVSKIREKVIMAVQQQKQITSNSDQGQHEQMPSPAGQKVIRYLGGRAVAKERTALQNALKSSVKKGSVSQTGYLKWTMLKSMEGNYEQLTEALDGSSSLSVMETHQNTYGGLTYITNETFLFFRALEQKRLQIQTKTNLTQQRCNILDFTQKLILKDENIAAQFEQLASIPDTVQPHPAVTDNLLTTVTNDLYHSLVKRFLRVSNNGYRKYILENLGRKKELPHRIAVLSNQGGQDDTVSHDTDTIINRPKRLPRRPIRFDDYL